MQTGGFSIAHFSANESNSTITRVIERSGERGLKKVNIRKFSNLTHLTDGPRFLSSLIIVVASTFFRDRLQIANKSAGSKS
jgi:hypothetical protein